MKHTNKKGFTIVELVIVIAVIAILAAVLIPTFSNLIKKANISNDTAIAKNLNTAAITAQADTFGQAIEAAKEAGYLVAHLNAKADNIFFVWEDDTNQFLLYDLDAKKVLYSNTKDFGDPDASWYFTVNTKAEKDAVLAALANVNCNYLVGDVAAVKDILAAGGDIYIDESLILNNDNRLDFVAEGVTVTVNLGNTTLTSDGSIQGQPIQIKKGNVTINGGIVGATGEGVDLDGKVFSSSIKTEAGTVVTINGTELNADPGAGIHFGGTSTLNGVKSNTYFYTYGNGQTILENCTNTVADSLALWMTNTIKHEDGSYTYDGTSKMTVNGGKFTNTFDDGVYATASVLGGTLILNDVELNSVKLEDGKYSPLFYVSQSNASIIITGGTFNGVAFEDVTDWSALCRGNYTVTVSEDGKTVTITK